MSEQIAVDAMVAAAIRVCDRLVYFLKHVVSGRKRALEDAKYDAAMLHAQLVILSSSFSRVQRSLGDNAILERIFYSLERLENEVMRQGTMSMFAYRLQSDSRKVRWRLYFENIMTFIGMLRPIHPSHCYGWEREMTAVETTVSQEIADDSRSRFSELSQSKPLTTRIDYNEICMSDEVNLSGRELSDTDATQVAKSLRGHRTRVTRLLLDDNKIGHEGAAAIAAALESNSKLQELGIDNNNIGDKGAVAIAMALRSNKTLQHLRLSKNNIGDDGAIALAEALKSNSTLHELELDNNNISSDGAKAIAVVLGERNRTLQQLWLSHNKIGDEGALAIAEALESESKSTIQNLSMQYNLISDGGAVAIAEALKTNTSLQVLGLRNKGIGNRGAAAIVDALNFNSALQNLYIETFESKNISQTICDEIQRLLSNENRDERIRRGMRSPKPNKLE